VTALTTPDEIGRALAQLGRHDLMDHQPDGSGQCPRCDEICPFWGQAVRALRSAGWQVAVMPPHSPSRPGWVCRPCGADWPCAQARVTLGDQYAGERPRPELLRLMSYRMARAATDLGVPPERLRIRFVGWV
jgi:hypothetical protein